jgi:hypothetical protein
MHRSGIDDSSLKRFGWIMGSILLGLVLYVSFRHRAVSVPLIVGSATFFIAALINPACLRLTYSLWMRLAFVLAWVNTRLLLLLIFYLVFTPIGIIMRCMGKDLLHRKINASFRTYWLPYAASAINPKDYERMF